MERSASAFEALMEAAEAIDPGRRLAPSDYARGSIKDMLAHLDAWHRMFLEWERVGRTGEVAEMPAPGYTWKTTPELNMVIHQRHTDDPWEMVVVSLRESHAQARGIVESYTDDESFEKQRYRWTGSTSVGSYAVSATTSHYDWAMRHLKRSRKAWAGEDAS